MKATFWWIVGILGLWIGAKPGGGDLILAITGLIGMVWLIKKFFDHIEREREVVLDDFADRLARANARRLQDNMRRQ